MSDALDTAAKPIKKPKRVLPERFKSYKGVWVFIEHEHGHVHPVSWELLGKGRELADKLGVELAGVLMGGDGDEIRAITAEVGAHGTDLCYLAQHPVLHDYRNQSYTLGMTELVNTYQPEILLLGATTQGRDLAGSVATTLLTGLTADCTGLDIDPSDRSLLSSRPTFGGSLMCTIVNLATRPQMATVRPRVMPMPARDPARPARVVEHALQLDESAIVTKVLDFIPDARADKPQLPFADFIVSGGRGLGKPENFQLVAELARTLGAEVGASRPAVHAGWADAERQVGQSGKTVRPKLYIAAGISGAVQHRVGMEGADAIAGINLDPGAPLFDFANYALIGNVTELLPALDKAFARRLATARTQRAQAHEEADRGEV
ncbi:electron transfer flavoprotein subunit alpha/FixB family protein [Pseudothauera nasutitermitis]|uniref:Electron transfer flavoprotein subunit alpha/FixB family protein n=1 Tax=Pseudothauera nasutitermitis TaxID=2565930 RepID=A0A4S4AP62_9RHOO|nr:electron transfer flavoprotein subunit alpha/FixB family protein [Pseudothauera nasutitermitis]THF61448.1 electron transfer flavoprotein subunit alpha/FixB family protein [Pseudothauera nasutitermitis]